MPQQPFITPLEHGNSVELSPVYVLYRYRAFRDRDGRHSLRQILTENLWWFGSRTGFDDKRDSVLRRTRLTPKNLRRTICESGGTERDIRTTLNDATTVTRVTKAVQEKSIDTIGILCLSEFADHPRLWKDYADGGHGACLCLDTHRLSVQDDYRLYYPQEMQYSDAPKRCWNPETEDQLAEARAVLLCKDKKWEYQKEWRILWADGVGYHRIPVDALRAVILGSKLSKAKRRRVIRWAERGPWNPTPTIIESCCSRSSANATGSGQYYASARRAVSQYGALRKTPLPSSSRTRAAE